MESDLNRRPSLELGSEIAAKTSTLFNEEQQLAVALTVQVEMKKRGKHLVGKQSEKRGLRWCS